MLPVDKVSRCICIHGLKLALCPCGFIAPGFNLELWIGHLPGSSMADEGKVEEKDNFDVGPLSTPQLPM